MNGSNLLQQLGELELAIAQTKNAIREEMGIRDATPEELEGV